VSESVTLTEEPTAEQWFEQRRDLPGTHWSTCYRVHPPCAFWAGVNFTVDQVQRAVSPDQLQLPFKE